MLLLGGELHLTPPLQGRELFALGIVLSLRDQVGGEQLIYMYMFMYMYM